MRSVIPAPTDQTESARTAKSKTCCCPTGGPQTASTEPTPKLQLAANADSADTLSADEQSEAGRSPSLTRRLTVRRSIYTGAMPTKELALRVISYNLREHRAHIEIAPLAARHDSDVLCLQECDTTKLPQEVGELRLAATTARNRLGLAIYYSQERFELLDNAAFELRKSMHDRVMSPAHERLLAVRLNAHEGGPIAVSSFHAAPLSAGNSLRRKQINEALNCLREYAPETPSLMVGDYNYPWFFRGLDRRMTRNGYVVSRSDAPTYARYRYFSGHFDFAISDAVRIERVLTLPQGLSDHLPVLIDARYGVEQDWGTLPPPPSLGSQGDNPDRGQARRNNLAL